MISSSKDKTLGWDEISLCYRTAEEIKAFFSF